MNCMSGRPVCLSKVDTHMLLVYLPLISVRGFLSFVCNHPLILPANIGHPRMSCHVTTHPPRNRKVQGLSYTQARVLRHGEYDDMMCVVPRLYTPQGI